MTREIRVIPFGLNPDAGLRADTVTEEFSLELREVNGNPLLRLQLDTATGEYWLAAWGVKLSDTRDLVYIARRNLARLELAPDG